MFTLERCSHDPCSRENFFCKNICPNKGSIVSCESTSNDDVGIDALDSFEEFFSIGVKSLAKENEDFGVGFANSFGNCNSC